MIELMTEPERERDRDRDRQTDRHRQTETQTQTQRETETLRERERERERERQTDRQTDRQRQRQRERERDRQRDRETERGRERERGREGSQSEKKATFNTNSKHWFTTSFLPSTTAVFMLRHRFQKSVSKRAVFCWCSNSSKFVTTTQIISDVCFITMLLTPAQIKPKSSESRRNFLLFLPGVDASNV